ncbi:MAG: kelch repeat-containing protein [Gemmatimonadales bacterium]|nr:kelch repeat-containing protein [Gemmatimonadales bacterium]
MTCPRFARAPFALAVGVALLALGCHSDASSPSSLRGPTYAVSDGAHDGNPDFFFLPPLFKNPGNDADFDANAFNANLRPAVEICELGPEAGDGSRECVGGPAVKRFAPEVVTVHPEDEHYQANWNTDETVLDLTKFYRIRVLVGTELLGFADVDPVSSGNDLKSVETGEHIGLVDGRTLPIKFRIENRALCGSPESPCTTETVNLETGGGITLTTETETFQFDIPPGTEATFGGQPVTDITFSLETCEGIAVDLPVFGDCLRVTTFLTVEGASGTELALTNAARISMCVLAPGLSELQEALITLHQQDGALVRALPHVTPNCETISALPAGWRGLAVRGWRWARNLAVRAMTPKMLYARSRAAAFNLGGGGETDRFGSTCDGGAASGPASVARPMLVDCPPSSAPALVATATRVTARTTSDFQFALPAMMEYVNPDDALRTATEGTSLPTAVRILDWYSAAVEGATVAFLNAETGDTIGTSTTGTDGIAQILWLIAEGENSIVASGFGIAGPNNYPGAEVKPFMPDISPGATQQAVALGTGRLEFSATGESPIEGVWTAAGELPEGRRDHTATLLPDGDVLIVGGTASGAFIFNADAESFTATGAPLFNHGQFATATLLLDGRVLVVGGSGAPQSAELYDPSTGSFTATAGGATEGTTNAPRVVHSATLLPDGRVLIAGGQTPGTSPPQSIVQAEIYDPETDAFTPIVDLTEARAGHGAALLADGTVLIAGGRSAAGGCLASAEVFHPESGIFTLTGAMSIGRCGLQWNNLTVLPDGTAFVAVDDTNAELYDPARGTFTLAGAPSVRHTAGSVTLLADGRVLLAGGSTGAGPITTSATEIFNPATGLFTLAAPMTIVRQQHSATRLGDGRVLVVGGFSTDGDVGSAELFSAGGSTIP